MEEFIRGFNGSHSQKPSDFCIANVSKTLNLLCGRVAVRVCVL